MRALLLCLLCSSAFAQAPGPRKPCDGELKARATAVDERFLAFRDLKLAGSPREFKQRLTHAANELRALEKEYRALVASGCGLISVEASVMIGRANEELAAKFGDVEPPKGLDADQQAMFRSELKNQGAPLDARARAAFEEASRLATTLGVNGNLVRYAREQLDGGTPGNAPRPADGG